MTHSFYGSAAWQKMRARVRARFSYCAMCRAVFKPGQLKIVDHIKPRRIAPNLALEISNLWVLCETCHSSTKARQENGQAIKQIGADGYPVNKPVDK